MAHQLSAGSGTELGHVQGRSQRSGHDRERAVGEVIREIRCALGWSQGRLAAELGRVSARPTVTREMVSRWSTVSASLGRSGYGTSLRPCRCQSGNWRVGCDAGKCWRWPRRSPGA